MVACELANHKHQNTKHHNQKARRRSPSQICVSPSQGQQSKQRKGQEPNRNNHKIRFAKDTVVKTHCVATDSKTCSKRISCPPNEVRHAICVVAKKTTMGRICYTLSPNPASQSPLTSTCSCAHVQSKNRYHKTSAIAGER